MRAAIDADLLEVAPGSVAAVSVDVANTADVIDGVAARVIGLDDQYVTATPKLLPLFPDARGTLQLSLAVPAWFPAGRRQVAVEVQSHGALEPSVYLDLSLDVAARPAMRVSAQPRLVRTRRTARFVLQLHNEGNVPIDISLRAVDIDRSCECTFSQNSVRVDAGTSVALFMVVRCPRMLTGGEVDRTITVEATPSRLDLSPDDPPADADAVTGSRTVITQVHQKPLVSRGLMTALILAGIVALWAGAFLLGLTKVFASDPLTKDAPASFFVTDTGKAANAVGFNTDVNAPAGAIPKTGQVPAGVGAQISGTVRAASDQLPVGRILVQAVRIKNGKPTVISAAATQTDGTYTLAGLFPIDYYVEFSSPGFHTVYYPSAHSLAGAQLVATEAQGTHGGINAVIAGDPAKITGSVKQSGAVNPVTTTVSAHPLEGSGKTVTRTTDASGSYTLPGLPAPGTYEITFTAPGYQTTAITDSVNGGDERFEPDIVLGAGTASITGFVRDGSGQGLGGATVTTTVNGNPVSVMTPTTGAVGEYELDNLPTPATYVITYSAPGHGSTTKVINLDPGKGGRRSVTLDSGTASVSGTVVTVQGGKDVPLGGVTVTVGGASTAAGTSPITTTLTNGTAVGTFTVNGLTAPGSYTITATLAGYGSATLPFTLSENGPGANVRIVLSQATGTLQGTVSGPCAQSGCVGDLVSITDGATVQQVDVTDTGYVITGLHPGTYSVTVTDPDLLQKTAMVTIVASTTPQTQNFTLSH